jgi:hypothetical protein
MSQCSHRHQIGDNYGITCQDCGQVLAGYGYWGEGSHVCIHQFVDDGAGEKVCFYCDRYQNDIEAQAALDAEPR